MTPSVLAFKELIRWNLLHWGNRLFHLEQWFININPMSKMPVQDFGSKIADQTLQACDSMHERVIKTTKFILRKERKIMGNQES